MEDFVLATSEIVPAITTNVYRLIHLGLYWEQALIVIHLRGEHGEFKEFSYGGNAPNVTDAQRTKAVNMMRALNTANLSAKSLQRRVLEQLTTDGLLTGTISGAPD